MKSFQVRTAENELIRFNVYEDLAPVTSQAFLNALPFKRLFMHARISGEEIWTDSGPELDIVQENASVFTEPGEIVLGPLKPVRAKTAGCLGIYYGEGKGLDCCNIFGRVFAEDLPKLKVLGQKIWKYGVQELSFERTG